MPKGVYKHKPQQLFKKGHKFVGKGKKTQFKKGHIPWHKGKKGVKPSPFKGKGKGYITKSGYKRLCQGEKEPLEHRIIIEKSIGRKLHPWEIVHHINGKRLDNRLINLRIMTRSEHKKLHSAEKL
jgi:hypothetical protein